MTLKAQKVIFSSPFPYLSFSLSLSFTLKIRRRKKRENKHCHAMEGSMCVSWPTNYEQIHRARLIEITSATRHQIRQKVSISINIHIFISDFILCLYLDNGQNQRGCYHYKASGFLVANERLNFVVRKNQDEKKIIDINFDSIVWK